MPWLARRYLGEKTLFEQAAVFGQAKHLVVLMKHLCHGSIIVKQPITTTLPAMAAATGRRRGHLSRTKRPRLVIWIHTILRWSANNEKARAARSEVSGVVAALARGTWQSGLVSSSGHHGSFIVRCPSSPFPP
jgi:hypothetical protein